MTVLGGSISTGAVASRKQAKENPNDVWSLVRIYMQKNINGDLVFSNNARCGHTHNTCTTGGARARAASCCPLHFLLSLWQARSSPQNPHCTLPDGVHPSRLVEHTQVPSPQPTCVSTPRLTKAGLLLLLLPASLAPLCVTHRSATKSYITSLCLEKFLDNTSDLVFVEFIANDGSEMDLSYTDNQKARFFERFLRKILGKPNAPAVIMMQVGAALLWRG